MAKKSSVTETTSSMEEENLPRPRLHKLTVRNFRAVGKDPVTLELDDIVVLVGPNNSGKSSILRAYEVVMKHGSNDGKLTINDFPKGKIDPNNLPEIELETVVYDAKAPGEKWIRRDDITGEMFVRERWTWLDIGDPKKVGWEVEKGDWHESEGPWGAPGVAQPARPEPHRISAFDSPETQANEIVKLLQDVLNERIKEIQEEKDSSNEQNEYHGLINSIIQLQKKIVQDATQEIEKVEKELNSLIGQVFPGEVVKFDPQSDNVIEKALTFFKEPPRLIMGPRDGYQSSIENQGSGARRTLLWAALRVIAERGKAKTKSKINRDDSPRPHVLLIDEPELCLHPNAVREACKVLYDLAGTDKWQVVVTTHSPVFIDLSRDKRKGSDPFLHACMYIQE